MSTYTALHVQSVQTGTLLGSLSNWLKLVQKTNSVTIKRGKFPEQFYNERFIAGEDYPNLLVLEANPPGWQTVYYNSFHDMGEITNQVSKTLSCLVIVVMAQSVSEAYFVSVHQEGKTVRVLHWVGDIGEWIAQEGQPLPFERSPLGQGISNDDEVFYVFERESVIEYCNQLGLKIWNDEDSLSTDCMVLQPARVSKLQMFRTLLSGGRKETG